MNDSWADKHINDFFSAYTGLVVMTFLCGFFVSCTPYKEVGHAIFALSIFFAIFGCLLLVLLHGFLLIRRMRSILRTTNKKE